MSGGCVLETRPDGSGGGGDVDGSGAAEIVRLGELASLRSIGKAHYENADTPPQFKPAIEAFGRCIVLAPDSAEDRFNLGLTLLRAERYEEALDSLAEALRLRPDLPAALYVAGIVHKRLSRTERAIEYLKRVTAADPACAGAYYNLGVCYKVGQEYEKAVAAFTRAVELRPGHPSGHLQLMTLYRRLGETEEVKRHKEIFNRLKDSVDASEKTAEALERSRYSHIILPPRQAGDLVPDLTSRVRFVEATALAGLPEPGTHGTALAQFRSSGVLFVVPGRTDPEAIRTSCMPLVGNAVTLADYDSDSDLDIYVVNCSADKAESNNWLYRNEGDGTFVEASGIAGVADSGMGFDAVFGDYDNDGHNDLYVVNFGPNKLYHNNGDGAFEDVSAQARADEPQFGSAALLFDYDHDNDLDILVGNCTELLVPSHGEARGAALLSWPGATHFAGQSNTLLRNNGDGTFDDLTDEAGLLIAFDQTRDALFADFDGDDDTDLLVVNATGESRLFANARLGKFSVGGSFVPPIPAGGSAAAVGDFNRDGYSDLIIAAAGGLVLYSNDGRANFNGTCTVLPENAHIERIGVLDYNNDGWSDLLVSSSRSLYLLAGDGRESFRDVSAAVGFTPALLDISGGEFAGGETSAPNIADFATGDLDGDGDVDIVLHTRNQGPRILMNETETAGNWLDVHLTGRKVNRSGYGATVEVSAGGHYQKQTYRSGVVHFGLGDLEGVDVVRVTWPNGVAQNVIRPAINGRLDVVEQIKVSASCGFLYTLRRLSQNCGTGVSPVSPPPGRRCHKDFEIVSNGHGYELVNEILGVGPLGVPMAPGVYHQPDCTELTKIESDQLRPREGIYELRLTEELRETMYADRFTLRVVDHPAELEIVPNEYFSAPPFPEDRFYAVAERRPPVWASDDRGGDVLELIREHDGRVATFGLTPYEGLAAAHAITLDLGDLSGADRIMLFLDGWIYWPESSTVMAIDQDPRYAIAPLLLEVRDEAGRWQTAIASVGLPTSKGLVVPIDLTGLFPGDDYRVRLSTTLCVYFDRIFVGTDDQAARCRVVELPVAAADLRFRGFSRMSRDALGYERFDYAAVSPTGAWNPPQGMFTRYGDVTPLLAAADDMYVIFGPGDELALQFDGSSLPALPGGWTRDYIFYANGWVKDGDLNTASSQTVTPLPFHGMSEYPYAASEQYPDTDELRRYRETYNTRPSRRTVGRLPLPVR